MPVSSATAPMSDRRRLIVLIMIMSTVSLMVGALAIGMLYRAAFSEEQARLVEAVKSHARLIEAIARFDAVHSRDAHPEGWKAATLGQVIDAHNHDEGFGKTGEFTIARREEDRIVFLLKQRLAGSQVPTPVPIDGRRAEPMQRALAGQPGAMVGFDYRGERVLAAYEPIALLDLGIVAKIDLSEIRAPFIRAGQIAGFIAILVVLIGAVCFVRLCMPMVQRLEESAVRSRGTLEAALDGIIIMNHEGHIIEFNPAAEKMFGYARADVIGKSLAETIIPPNLRGQHAQSVGRYLATRQSSMLGRRLEMVGMRADGSEFPVELSVTRLGLSEPPMFTGFLRDLTQRRQAEEALRESNERLRTVVTGASIVLFAIDKNGIFTLSDGRGLDALGLKPGQVVGQSVFDVYRDFPNILADVRRALSGEAFITTADVSGIVFETRYSPIHDREGQFVGTIGVGTDITERKRLEAQFLQAQKMEAVGRLAGEGWRMILTTSSR